MCIEYSFICLMDEWKAVIICPHQLLHASLELGQDPDGMHNTCQSDSALTTDSVCSRILGCQGKSTHSFIHDVKQARVMGLSNARVRGNISNLLDACWQKLLAIAIYPSARGHDVHTHQIVR